MKFYIKEAKRTVEDNKPDLKGHMWVYRMKERELVRVDTDGNELGKYTKEEFDLV